MIVEVMEMLEEHRRVLAAALRELEAANEALAAGRTPALYCAMIEAGQQEALLRLDLARAAARAALASRAGQ